VKKGRGRKRSTRSCRENISRTGRKTAGRTGTWKERGKTRATEAAKKKTLIARRGMKTKKDRAETMVGRMSSGTKKPKRGDNVLIQNGQKKKS